MGPDASRRLHMPVGQEVRRGGDWVVVVTGKGVVEVKPEAALEPLGTVPAGEVLVTARQGVGSDAPVPAPPRMPLPVLAGFAIEHVAPAVGGRQPLVRAVPFAVVNGHLVVEHARTVELVEVDGQQGVLALIAVSAQAGIEPAVETF